MATFVQDCPHCSTTNVGFTLAGEYNCKLQDITAVAVSAICNACLGPVCLVVEKRAGVRPSDNIGDILRAPHLFRFIDFFPALPANEAPENVPAAVARAFEQAAGSRRAGHFDAACAMYRKAMELGLKDFSPDIEAWRIEKRIDKMAAEHRITPELQAWAHELRLDGNEAVHGDAEATRDIASQMHEFCKFLLIYLYSLPAQVAVAKARRENA